MGTREVNYEEWADEAKRLFGDDPMDWRFECPVCGYRARVRDWKDVGAISGEAGFSCLGRHLPEEQRDPENGGPCDYAGGGLFRLNPVIVHCDGTTVEMFEFAKN